MLTGEARIDAIVLSLKNAQGIHLPEEVMPEEKPEEEHKQEGE